LREAAQITGFFDGFGIMASRPLSDRTLVAPSGLQLQNTRDRLNADIRSSLIATMTLGLAGVIGVMLLELWALSGTVTLGLQEIFGVIVFATCTWLMYERGELKLRLYSFEPADHTMTGEIRALLNRLPDGAAYQRAIEAEQRAYTTGELEQIRDRVRAFAPMD
jgi:hypothetical protein